MLKPETIADQAKVKQWTEIIEFLKSDDCRIIIKFYSSSEGWANLAYKAYRVRIDAEWDLIKVKALVASMLLGYFDQYEKHFFYGNER